MSTFMYREPPTAVRLCLLAAALCAAALCAADGASAAVLPPTPPCGLVQRPTPANPAGRALPGYPVRLKLSVEAEAYRWRLERHDVDADAFEAFIADSMAAVLRRHFPFIDWRVSGGAADTVTLEWFQHDNSTRNNPTQLRVRLSSCVLETGVPPQHNFEFEDGTTVTRPQRTWRKEDVRSEWTQRLEQHALSQEAALLRVFGVIPLRVKLSQIQIGQALRAPLGFGDRALLSDSTEEVEFLARIRVRPLGFQATAVLTPCYRPDPDRVFSCALDKAQQGAVKTYQAPELRQLIVDGNQVTLVSLHLL
ncbi:MAG TPA: hypothetical protein VKA84_29560, partial [Gemmatimonadaceae bacterium]|nr:hypothetical protein [Gemmatimonadaceae bacterium]